MSIYRLSSLLAPSAVAVIGASPRPASVGRAVLENLRKAGFKGEIGVVNPRYPEIGGFKTVRTFADLPFVPDLIVVTAPSRFVSRIIADAGERGVAGAIIISAEMGRGKGSYAEAANVAARKSGIRLIGPNCLGLMVPSSNLNASFAAHMPRRGHLALISQSGAIAAGMVDWAAVKDIGFSGIVSIGDQLDVDIADMLDYYAADFETRAILLYIEAITDARKFMSAARAAARVKPVVVVKSGRLAHGAQAAATHTGAFAGADAVYDAAFRRAGMLRVFDLRELFDCAETLGRVSAPRGKRVAILTNGGGIGVLAVDRLAELGGIPATLSKEVCDRLNATMPPSWSGSNPVDIMGDADPERYATALSTLLADPDNDAVLVMNVHTAMASPSEIAEAVIRLAGEERLRRTFFKPVFAVWVGAEESIAHAFDAAGIPNYPTEDDAVRSIMNLVRYREAAQLLTEVPPSLPKEFDPDTEAARLVIEKALREGRSWLDPIEVGALLAAYQIPMVPTLAAPNADAAVAWAEPFLAQGVTVVVKVMSRDITHKSDVGGVVLNLTSVEAVRSAVVEILSRAAKLRPTAQLDGVIVQPMIMRRKARELTVGIVDDPTFGPVIAFGHGGTGVEIIDDRSLALPPLDLPLANSLIARTRVSKLLQAYRDVPAVKDGAVALTLVKLSQMAADFPEIHELDINPLLADENGAVVIDARVMVRPAQRKFAGLGNTTFAVKPYPSQWERHLQVKDGWRVLARPLRPDDEPAIHAFLKHVTPEDLRLRFFAAMKEFSHAFIARLTQIDYARAMAFIAIDEATGETLGVVRIHSDSIYESGEYAILLRSDLKGKGLGWALMKLIIEYARAEGLKYVCGQVLRENVAMLRMCRHLGFEAKADHSEPDILNVTLALTEESARAAAQA
ncbi:bifunctional acetate--CoA ligase family protein/GNAT family N-acetyltransferase [Rhodopseudomonas sp. HC1]|uniref:bifunctional acetate--CoA ligase family protein/GNAT family N-acetyltransferase n=1 Tax=Rhodopseudomonas infernalis TaxID=2897386 RepID=UPI001EE8F53D|nr:bifunctional acetate--CoA ligase family protein/GNAT family N-acetyltransferase [Rhodopseudomonas infernalis]MCG6205081.1 bifunctional acetate--CoA ligase family protein/GNAT family N-acetyltransferase [Rhodopseudomonas infernalis]